MNKKITIFGIGAILCLLLFSSVFSVPAKATTDDSYTQVWSEWVNEYHGRLPNLQSSDADAYGKQYWWGWSDGFEYRMGRYHGGQQIPFSNGNWVFMGTHGDDYANPADLSLWKEYGAAVKYADIIYFAGHGQGGKNAAALEFGVKEFGINPALDDYEVTWQDDSNAYHTVHWGDYDAEWLIFSACSVLGPDADAAITNWGDNIPSGLHIINGFQTDAKQYDGAWSLGHTTRGARYADYLHQSGYDSQGHTLNAVGYAWQRATFDDAQDCTPFYAHSDIRGASVAAAIDVYIADPYDPSHGLTWEETLYYFYVDTVQTPLRDPFVKNTGNIQYYNPHPVYYSWVVDWPHWW